MLKKQMVTLVRIFYNTNEHKANDMIADLLSHGLLIKKQATDTKTCLYIMTKFPLPCTTNAAQGIPALSN